MVDGNLWRAGDPGAIGFLQRVYGAVVRSGTGDNAAFTGQIAGIPIVNLDRGDDCGIAVNCGGGSDGGHAGRTGRDRFSAHPQAAGYDGACCADRGAVGDHRVVPIVLLEHRLRGSDCADLYSGFCSHLGNTICAPETHYPKIRYRKRRELDKILKIDSP